MQLEEQDLLTLPDRLISPPVLVGFVLLDLKFSVYCFVDYCVSFCLFSLDPCVVCPLIYGF
jgi:hypothetical protein